MKCTETVDRGHGRWTNYQPCGREAVEDGLCKIHLRVRDRRRSKDAEWHEKFERGEALRDEAERLSEALGVSVHAEFTTLGRGGYTGNFVVPAEWLRAQVAR